MGKSGNYTAKMNTQGGKNKKEQDSRYPSGRVQRRNRRKQEKDDKKSS